MKRILVPIIAAGLLLLAACSAPVISTPETRQLPLGQFNPPAELRGTWRLSPSTIAGKKQPPESLHFSETNIFLQPAAPGILEDLSVTWQDWIIRGFSHLRGYLVGALGDVLAKALAAAEWVKYANEHAEANGGKSWGYLLIPGDSITESATLAGLTASHRRE